MSERCVRYLLLLFSVVALTLEIFAVIYTRYDLFPNKTPPDGWIEKSIIRVYEHKNAWWVQFDDETSLEVWDQVHSVDIKPVYKNETSYTYEDIETAPEKRWDRAVPLLVAVVL